MTEERKADGTAERMQRRADAPKNQPDLEEQRRLVAKLLAGQEGWTVSRQSLDLL